MAPERTSASPHVKREVRREELVCSTRVGRRSGKLVIEVGKAPAKYESLLQ